MEKLLQNKLKTQLLLIAVIMSFGFSLSAQINPASVCDNLDFRRGDFTGWVGRTSVYPSNHPDANNCGASVGSPPVFTTCPNGSGNSCNGCYSGNGLPTPAASAALGPIAYYMNPGIVPGRHTIISASTPDPYACNNIMTLPPNEPFCARLGNGGVGTWGNGVGWEVDYLAYTFTVGPTNTLLTYKYATIFQDPIRDPSNPAHSHSIRPRFVVTVTDNATGKLIDSTCGKLDEVYDTIIPGYRECSLANIQSFGGNPYAPVGTAYRAWTTVGVDLRKYVGSTVTIEFNTWDCGWGGHFGYAYVSARCDAFKLTTQNCTNNGAVTVSAPPGFSYQWFPSGATTQDIVVNNPNPGDSVWVELTTVAGCKTSVGTRIYPVVIDAKYTPSATVVCPNTPINFTDQSTSFYTGNNTPVPIISWHWDFGDGDTSNVQNPSHTYADSGTYVVNLIIVNQNGCIDSIAKLVTVLPPPAADFVFADICVKGTANFANASSAIAPQFINNWLWTFHNSSTSTSQNPTFTYNTPGTYTVNLEVTTNLGCKHDTTKTIKIYPLPIANFTATAVCVGDTTFFTNTSLKGDPNDNLASAVWNFGDNSAFSSSFNADHAYMNSGTYQVQLIVVSTLGCVNDTTIPVTVHPKPVANFTANTPCLGTPVTFTDQSTPAGIITNWQWDFDDAGSTSTQQNPTHTYNTAMVYHPTLVVTSQYGCTDSVTIPIDIPPLPVAAFDANKYEGCVPLCVDFVDMSYSVTDTISKWLWDFGDGNTSALQYPSHCYTTPGVYTVTLTVTTANGCTNTKVWNAMIHVYPFPDANFAADPYETGESTPFINFYNQSSGEISWDWYFGDNSGDTIENPSHTYGEAGTYTVWLYVVNQYGCRDSIAKQIIINKEWTFYVPNAFTPGVSTGVNDGFIGKGTNIKEYKMWIFDRWGEMIYHCDSMDEPWNGKVNNGVNGEGIAQQDVYVWKINLVDIFGKKHKYIGTVTIVR